MNLNLDEMVDYCTNEMQFNSISDEINDMDNLLDQIILNLQNDDIIQQKTIITNVTNRCMIPVYNNIYLVNHIFDTNYSKISIYYSPLYKQYIVNELDENNKILNTYSNDDPTKIIMTKIFCH